MSDAERDITARLRGLGTRRTPEAIEAELLQLAPAPSARLTSEDLLEVFLARLRHNGGTAGVVADRAAAVGEIAAHIASRQPQRRFVAGHDPRLAALPWRDGGLLPRFGAAEDGDRVAVSWARCAIAESGSLALWVERSNPAVNNLLCDDHVVLVDRADIRRSLEDLWSDPVLRDADRRPRGLMLISGPSSTADIAMQLVLGAHGPRSLHAVVLA